MTTADYLNQLEQDRQDLVDNLETKGITGLSGDETFTELVPEVLNISGGGTTPTNFNELRLELDTLSTNFVNYINNSILNRTAYTNESVVLYTPASTHTKYVIHKRSSGKYRVVWFNCAVVNQTNTTNLQVNTFLGNSSYMLTVDNNITSMFLASPGFATPFGDATAYISDELDTPEDIINGMRNNTLTYRTATNNNYGMVEDTPNILTYSNVLCVSTIGKTNYTPDLINTRIISHNESFEVIS